MCIHICRHMYIICKHIGVCVFPVAYIHVYIYIYERERESEIFLRFKAYPHTMRVLGSFLTSEELERTKQELLVISAALGLSCRTVDDVNPA